MRDLVLGEPFIDLAPLDVGRFSAGATRPETYIV